MSSFSGLIRPKMVFVVTCKRCDRHIPAGVKVFPDQPIAVKCSLCGEYRRYHISNVFLGRPDYLHTVQAQSGNRSRNPKV
jgi:RNase P subunit RPR2